MTLTTGNLETSAESFDHQNDEGKVDVAGRSPARLAMARFRKDKLSMISFFVVVFFVLIAIISPILVTLGVLDPNTNHRELLNGFYPAGTSYGISWSHPLGIDVGVGRDLLSRLMFGTTFSMTVALAGAIITVTIGVVLGIISGFAGGWVDAIVGRFIDLTLAFPATLMLLALSQVVVERMKAGFDLLWIGPHLSVPRGPNDAVVNGTYIVVVLAAFGWPPVARLIRGQVLSLREREFVDAAILMGASRRRIYFKEILPNLWAPLLVYFTLLLPAYVSAEAALSYLGVGIKAPTPTLGNILKSASQYIEAAPVFFFAPAIIIAALVISFNLLGDGARDALDPKGDR